MASQSCVAEPLLPEVDPDARTIASLASPVKVKADPEAPRSVRVQAEPTGGGRRHSLAPRLKAARRSLVGQASGCRVRVDKCKLGRMKTERKSVKVKTEQKSVKVKTEQQSVKVKSEPNLKRKSKTWDPIRHFTHQVAVVRKFIPAPRKWERFLGNLGTGILGVRPLKKRKSSARGAIVPQSADAEVEGKAEAAGTEPHGFIFLFLNAGAARLQEWNGRTMSGFAPSLDRQRQVLKWESQRNDKTGRVISHIIEHVDAGAEVVVAVRSSPGEDFQILGRTRDFCRDSEARFLVEIGDHLIGERGSSRMHKFITAQCLDAGLKAGIGLVPHQYPLPTNRAVKPLFCSACCWRPATAVLTFGSLDQNAAEILQAETTKRTSPQALTWQRSSASDPPPKRLRGKQAIKRELDDTQPDVAVPLPSAVKVERADLAESSLSQAPRARRRWPSGVLLIKDDDDDGLLASSPVTERERCLVEVKKEASASPSRLLARGDSNSLCCSQEDVQRGAILAERRKALLEADPKKMCNVEERRKLLARLSELDSGLETVGNVEARTAAAAVPESPDRRWLCQRLRSVDEEPDTQVGAPDTQTDAPEAASGGA